MIEKRREGRVMVIVYFGAIPVACNKILVNINFVLWPILFILVLLCNLMLSSKYNVLNCKINYAHRFVGVEQFNVDLLI